MKRIVVVLLAVAGCTTNQPTEHYGFVARLGRDTVSVESVTRRGNTLVSDEAGEVYDFRSSGRCPARHTRDGMGAVPVDGPDRGSVNTLVTSAFSFPPNFAAELLNIEVPAVERTIQLVDQGVILPVRGYEPGQTVDLIPPNCERRACGDRRAVRWRQQVNKRFEPSLVQR